MREDLKKKHNIVSTICMTVFVILCIIPGAMYGIFSDGKVFFNSFGYGTFFVPVKAIKYIFTKKILMLLVFILAIICSMVYFMRSKKEKFHQKIWSYLPILILILYNKEIISKHAHLGFVYWIQVLLLVLVIIIQFYSENILEK